MHCPGLASCCIVPILLLDTCSDNRVQMVLLHWCCPVLPCVDRARVTGSSVKGSVLGRNVVIGSNVEVRGLRMEGRARGWRSGGGGVMHPPARWRTLTSGMVLSWRTVAQ